MNTLLTAADIRYAEKDILELRTASVRVQRIYSKAFALLSGYYPDGWWQASTGLGLEDIRRLYGAGSEEPGTLLQKWIKSSLGWKCIGCGIAAPPIGPDGAGVPERDPLSSPVELCSLALQASVWSQFEKTMLLHPLLRDELFWNGEELADIAAYLVPTYWSRSGLHDRPYECRPRSTRGIGIFQQWLPAPTVRYESEGGSVQVRWMTGVYVRRLDFIALGAYLKPSGGERIYLDPVFVGR
ncbi:hypothetical protein F4V43_03240 [Paenibacillus spiritus]|uniref:Uncharacterized protein n=1 Tax=Paenibacillus spiritus TaxID=2496557 RepID=A0A5J5GIJ6_9BACL|nr:MULTISPECIES: hypothetical protein [Paenibacillus]KAA9007518.1 hypothetical protein F4V43_03240 [Paenibacillus spiritus]